uniref:Uncharacterized protein n=1 Tax=uncultured Desulfobacterium sp. TaxID=201089 RepID=E1YAJ1_9BACT|nr:unknown protein [uncultured Desulfobacterium sp.]
MNPEAASEIFEGLSGGLRIHPWHITHKPLRIKKQEVNHQGYFVL